MCASDLFLSDPFLTLLCSDVYLAGLALRAAIPKLPGLLASGWSQPKGGPSGRPEGWGRENPGCLFCILSLTQCPWP